MFDKGNDQDYNIAAVQQLNATALSTLDSETALGAGDEMGKPESLGQFEQLVLTAVYLLHGQGYTVTITEKVDELAGRRVLIGGVFTSLGRLQTRGLVSSRLSTPTKERGGKAKRYFKITPAGERALAQAKASAQQLLDALGDLA